MEGPYLIEDLKGFLKMDDLSISKENLVINSETGLKCTVEEAIHLSCSRINTSDFVHSDTTFHNQDKIQKEYAIITRKGGPSHQYRPGENLSQPSHPHVTQVNRANRMGQFNSVEFRRKNNLVAGIFALLLGGFGAHKFYNGSWGWGIIYIIFFWTYIPAILSLIEGIRYLVNPTRYDQKYNGTPPFPMKW